MSSRTSLSGSQSHCRGSHEEPCQPLASSSSAPPGDLVQRTEVEFRVHQPAQKRMIRTGRRARVSVSLVRQVEGDAAGLPHIVRRVNESRRSLATTETRFDIESGHDLDPERKEKTEDGISTVIRFILETRIPSPHKRRLSNGSMNGNGYDEPEIDDSWLSEPESDIPEGAALKLHLRGGCLKLPERQGSKRRLGDEEQLPTLVWWVAGGQPRHKPLNGEQLREWKRRSNGYDKGNKKRGWVREFAFVMTNGRAGRNSEKPKAKGSQDEVDDGTGA